LEGLRETGFVQGENVAIEYRCARGRYGDLPTLASELVARKVDLIVSAGGEPAALAARGATSTIPIVFGIGGDPVRVGLVKSLNRPGGNATGVTLLTPDLEAKRLGVLRELLPSSPAFGVVINPRIVREQFESQELQARSAGRALSLRVEVVHASDDESLASALGELLKLGVRGILVAADPFFDTKRDWLVDWAARQRAPMMFQFREYVVAGGLIGYGIKVSDAYRQFGIYAGRVLNGASIAELPVLQSASFELVINLKTAQALGLAIPPTLLARADEVIE
jgi:putative ABC transport system substrate-binding protein